jgi:hypothetical protein
VGKAHMICHAQEPLRHAHRILVDVLTSDNWFMSFHFDIDELLLISYWEHCYFWGLAVLLSLVV